jgi:hypothetical protein
MYIDGYSETLYQYAAHFHLEHHYEHSLVANWYALRESPNDVAETEFGVIRAVSMVYKRSSEVHSRAAS